VYFVILNPLNSATGSVNRWGRAETRQLTLPVRRGSVSWWFLEA
jgi:hypothetical protein